MKRCPACNLPMVQPGKAYVASDEPTNTHGLVLICAACDARQLQLPAKVRNAHMTHAAAKALADPERFACKVYPTRGAAIVAAAMLGRPEYAERLLEGVLE